MCFRIHDAIRETVNLCLMKKQVKMDWSELKAYQISKKAQQQVKGGTDASLDHGIIEDVIDN